MNAHQIVATLLDEADFTHGGKSELSQLLGRDVWREKEEIEHALEQRRKQEQPRRAEEVPFSGRSRKKAADYFRSPERTSWPKMPETPRYGEVIQPKWGTKVQEPSMEIKGAEKYVPPAPRPLGLKRFIKGFKD